MTIIRIGLDTSKHVFQVHGVDENEQAVLRRQVRRSEMARFFAKLPPTRTRSSLSFRFIADFLLPAARRRFTERCNP